MLFITYHRNLPAIIFHVHNSRTTMQYSYQHPSTDSLSESVTWQPIDSWHASLATLTTWHFLVYAKLWITRCSLHTLLADKVVLKRPSKGCNVVKEKIFSIENHVFPLSQDMSVIVSAISPKGVWEYDSYHKTFSISRTKYQNLNVSCLLLQWSLPNPLKPGVKLRMKM